MERQTPNSNMAPPYSGQSNGQVNGNAYSYPNNTTNYQAPYQTPYQTSYQGPYQNYYPNNNQTNYYSNSTNSNNKYSNYSNTNPPYTNTTYPNTTASYNDVSGNNSYNNNSYHNNTYPNNPYTNNSYANNSYANNSYANNSYGNNPYANNPYQQTKNQTNTYVSTNPMPNQVQTNSTYQQPKEAPPTDIAPKLNDPIHIESTLTLEKDVTQEMNPKEAMPEVTLLYNEPPSKDVSMEASTESPVEPTVEAPANASTESSTNVKQDILPPKEENIVSKPTIELPTSDALSKDDEVIVKQIQDTFGEELTSEVTQALRDTSSKTTATISSQVTPMPTPTPYLPPKQESSFTEETTLLSQSNVPLKAASIQNTTTDSTPLKSEKVMSVGAWFGTLLLLLIPGVNIILMIVWACGCGNKNRCNMMRASLLLGILFTIIVTVLLLVFRDNINVMINSINDWISYLEF